jgi:hypothetical protein
MVRLFEVVERLLEGLLNLEEQMSGEQTLYFEAPLCEEVMLSMVLVQSVEAGLSLVAQLTEKDCHQAPNTFLGSTDRLHHITSLTPLLCCLALASGQAAVTRQAKFDSFVVNRCRWARAYSTSCFIELLSSLGSWL